ncbi:MAG: hypothetical protein Q8T09_11590 [Candidatus Melainabacteria bacterium]|nr:hypothetical protein [Candidatus Melainabacteria bacterium]
MDAGSLAFCVVSIACVMVTVRGIQFACNTAVDSYLESHRK